jgi:formylglycine-generating enzyme required for sulfatase activity
MKRKSHSFRIHLTSAMIVCAIGMLFISSHLLTSRATSQDPNATLPSPKKTPTPKTTTPPPKKRTPRNSRTAKSVSDSATATEMIFWNSIKDSTNPDDFKEYLKKYPDGEFADLAKNRLKKIEAAQPKAPTSENTEPEYWETIRNSKDAQDFKDYLQAYPNGVHAAIAGLKIKQLEAAKTTTPANTGPANSSSTSLPHTRTNQAGIEFVLIPPGSFMMGSTNGSSDEKPVHQVTISQPFYIGRYEVTQAQWQAVMGNNPSSFKDCGGNCPVEQVSWDDAQNFINKLNESNDGFKYRLPTEAEWEYACRAGTTGDYAGNLDDMAWYEDNSGKHTHPAGQKQANAFGLYDMHGNVWEWCRDWYDANYYASSPATDPQGPGSGQYRVLRGGSWGKIGLEPNLRSAYRNRNTPDSRVSQFGFRVVAVVRTP